MHYRTPRFLFFLTFITFSIACMAVGKATEDTISARRAFVDLPSDFLDLLPKDTRLDMLDYFDADSIYNAPNNLQGTSRLLAVTPDFLSVELTPVSVLQLKVLKMNNGKEILLTIYTVGLDKESRDSRIVFFDAGLRPLDTKKFFPQPKLRLFFDTVGFKTNMKEIEDILPFYNFFYEASPENSNLTGRLTYGDILSVEDAKIIDLLVRPEVVFVWNGKKFVTTE